jgi:recombination protein RecA
MDNNKISEFIKKTNADHGANSVILGTGVRQQCDTFSTGSLLVDVATGIGGIPRGRMTEVFGPESSGKTTLAQHVVADAQKKGHRVLYIDSENAIDATYASHLGINLDELAISQPDTAEIGLAIALDAIESGAFGLVVVDSIAAMVPRVELEGQIGDAHMGVMARLMSQTLRKMTKPASSTNTAVLWINQVRSKIGVVYGDPNVTTGGRALNFYASMRIKMQRSTLQKDGTDVLGNTAKVQIVKNKLAAPFKECEPEIIYGEGFSKEAEIIDLAVDYGLLEKAGSWYSQGGLKIGQGKETVRQYLQHNPDKTLELEKQIRSNLGLPVGK